MPYTRTDGSVANYNFAEYTARYRNRMGKYYCKYCDRTGTMVMYNRHCLSMMHISAKELYLKTHPTEFCLPPAPTTSTPKPKLEFIEKQVPDSVYIIDESTNIKPPPLIFK